MLTFRSLNYEAASWKASESGFECRQGQEIFLFQSNQTGCDVHPAFYLLCNGKDFSGVKRPGREAGLLTSIQADVKKTCGNTSTPLCSFMDGA